MSQTDYVRIHGTLTHTQYLVRERNSVILELVEPCSDLRQYVIVPRDVYSSWRSDTVIGRSYTLTHLQQRHNESGHLIAHVASLRTVLVAGDGFACEGVACSSDRYDLCSYQGEVTAVDESTGECQLDGIVSLCLHGSLGQVLAKGLPSPGDTVWVSAVHWLKGRRSLVACVLSRFYILNRWCGLSVSCLSSARFLSVCTLFEYGIPACGLAWFGECVCLVESVANSECNWSRTKVLNCLRQILSLSQKRCCVREVEEFTSRPHFCTAMRSFVRPFTLSSIDNWQAPDSCQFGSDSEALSTEDPDSATPLLICWIRPDLDGSWLLLGKSRHTRVLLSSACVDQICRSKPTDGADNTGLVTDFSNDAPDQLKCDTEAVPEQMWLLVVSKFVDLSPNKNYTLFIDCDHIRLAQPHSCRDNSVSRSVTRFFVLARSLLLGSGERRRFFLHAQLSPEGSCPSVVAAGRLVIEVSGERNCCWYSLLSAGSVVVITVPNEHADWLRQRVTSLPGAVTTRFPNTPVCCLPATAYCSRDKQAVDTILQQSTISVEALLSPYSSYCSGDIVDVKGHLIVRSHVKLSARQVRLVLCDLRCDHLRLSVFTSERLSADLPPWLQPGFVLVLRGVRVSARVNTGALTSHTDISLVLEDMSDFEIVDWRPVSGRSLSDLSPTYLPHLFISRASGIVAPTRWCSLASAVEVLSVTVKMHCSLCENAVKAGGVCSFVGCHVMGPEGRKFRCEARARVLVDDGTGCVPVHVRDELLFLLLGYGERLKARALAHGPLVFDASGNGDQLLRAICLASCRVSRPLLWALKRLPIRSGYDRETFFCENLQEVTNGVMSLFDSG